MRFKSYSISLFVTIFVSSSLSFAQDNNLDIEVFPVANACVTEAGDLKLDPKVLLKAGEDCEVICPEFKIHGSAAILPTANLIDCNSPNHEYSPYEYPPGDVPPGGANFWPGP